MTLEDLKQLYMLRKTIEYQSEKLQTMRDSLGLHSPTLSDMPKASGARDKIGDIVPDIVDEYYELMERIRTLQEKEKEIMDWINTQPPRIGTICGMKYLDNKSWQEIADFLDDGSGKFTADSVRMTLHNHLKLKRAEES